MSATPLTPERQVIYDSDVDFNSVMSEAVLTKIAKSAMFAQLAGEFPISFEYEGFFRPTQIEAKSVALPKRYAITRYILNVKSTGTTTANKINVAIYDSSNAFVDNLFDVGSEPSLLTASSKDGKFVGKNLDESPATEILSDMTGVTYNSGTVNLTELEIGYTLRPFLVSAGSGAIDGSLTIFLQRIE